MLPVASVQARPRGQLDHKDPVRPRARDHHQVALELDAPEAPLNWSANQSVATAAAIAAMAAGPALLDHAAELVAPTDRPCHQACASQWLLVS